jgi:type 1 glutamine amidotransferase
LLLQNCLTNVPGVTTVVYSNGWPSDPQAFADAAAVVVYCDGGVRHPLLQEERLRTMGALLDQGVGLACLHYAVEPTREKGQAEFMDWIGGAFEIHWSVNPTWEAEFKNLPQHPITRGVAPFKLRDEWYFHMRFRDGMKGVTPILSAVPTASTTNRADGPHENNPAVREMVARGEAQHVAWAAERANGARGFGCTGGHYHENWGDANFRKVMLNAILWVAKVEVPPNGVASQVTPEQLNANLDDKRDRRPAQ